MRKLFAAVVMLLVLSGTAMAANIQVQKGDTLSQLGKKVGVAWQAIAKANGLSAPYVIFPGQKLSVPDAKSSAEVVKSAKAEDKDWRWRYRGGMPYKNFSPKGIQAAVDKFDLPADVKEKLKGEITAPRHTRVLLHKGDKAEQMIFGADIIRNKVLYDWQDNGKPEPATRYSTVGMDGYEYFLDIPDVCANVCWWRRPLSAKVEGRLDVPVFPGLSEDDGSRVVPATPLFGGKGADRVTDEFELYVGAGVYSSADHDASGRFWWLKGRYRPFEYELNNSTSLGVGAFGFLAGGDGNDREWKYNWFEWNVGPTFKLNGKNWDADIDLGLGKLYNWGGDGSSSGRQTDTVFKPSAHLNLLERRNNGESWFPKTEIDIEGRFILGTTVYEGSKYDNTVIAANVRQFIYDWNATDNVMVSPGVNLGVGREFGLHNPGYLQMGPAVALTAYKQDVLQLSIVNYKEQMDIGGQWQWLSASLSLGGSYKAYKAANITEVSPEEMAKLSGPASAPVVADDQSKVAESDLPPVPLFSS